MDASPKPVHWAIGILPFKDGYYSSTNKQVGGQTVGPEKNPDREALMATLSCAMVGPMDGAGLSVAAVSMFAAPRGINLLNASRTMTSCRGDGVVLKPDRPVSTVDWCFKGTGSESSCYGVGRVHYHFNNDHAPLDPSMITLSGKEYYVVYNWYTGEVVELAKSTPLSAGYEGHIYAVAAPVVSGWAFIGEVDNPAAVTVSASGVSAEVTGAKGETVRACAVRGVDLMLKCASVAFGRARRRFALGSGG
eukprot:gene5384-23508_t